MPRRGNAASRQARQRRGQRPAAPRPPAQSVDARLDKRASASTTSTARAQSTPAAPPAPKSQPGRAPAPYASGPSGLSERARAEYHYVARDLRNIAQAAALMAIILGAAVIAIRILGIGPG